jgi:hypothetical protein
MNYRTFSHAPGTHVSKMDAIPGSELARPGVISFADAWYALHTYGVRRLAQRGARAFCCVLRKKITLMM